MSVRGWGWSYPISPGGWYERLASYEEDVAAGHPLQHMVDIVRSVIESGRVAGPRELIQSL